MNFEGGITILELKNEFPDISEDQFRETINKLLRSGHFEHYGIDYKGNVTYVPGPTYFLDEAEEENFNG